MPRLIRVDSVITDRADQPLRGSLVVSFSLYHGQQGGSPLWTEDQTVELDPRGRYAVLLGATRKDGLPLDLFAEGKAQWLGIQVQGEAEQPRILLAPVPYALKASDAETLGGKQ